MAPSAPARHVALLRGINVGGKNKLPMAALAEIFTACGARDVRTYIQSGNVVYSATAVVARTLAAKVEGRIRKDLGLTVPVVTRTGAELERAAAKNPFLAAGADPKTLHVAFLKDAPARGRGAALDPDRSPGDAFELVGKELYLHLPDGVARTKLTSAYLDATLGTVVTARNWKTVTKLVALLGAPTS